MITLKNLLLSIEAYTDIRIYTMKPDNSQKFLQYEGLNYYCDVHNIDVEADAIVYYITADSEHINIYIIIED